MTDPDYVTHDSWLHRAGRPDLIDEIADQVERRCAVSAASDAAEQVADDVAA